MTLKTCTKCGEAKPADRDHFDRDARCRDGLGPQCKVCHREFNRKSQRRRRATLEGRAASNEAGRKSQRRRREANPGYTSWAALLQRCKDPNATGWANYGGRGITVCDRWNPAAGGSFDNFLADVGPRPDGCSIERIDNDGNYEPGNCRWATAAEQRSNRRDVAR